MQICAYYRSDGGIINDPILLKLAEDHWLSIADSDVLLWARGVAVNSEWMWTFLNQTCHRCNCKARNPATSCAQHLAMPHRTQILSVHGI